MEIYLPTYLTLPIITSLGGNLSLSASLPPLLPSLPSRGCCRTVLSCILTTLRYAVLCHERLSIVGVGASRSVYIAIPTSTYQKAESGAQPLTNADNSIVLAVNGEIYNHRLVRKNLEDPYHFKTTSDCEVIIPLVRLSPTLITPLPLYLPFSSVEPDTNKSC